MINLNWQELGIIEITNLYLCGRLDTPPDLTDEAILEHTPEAVTIMNTGSFMTDGPGRYATAQAAREFIIEQFMNGTIMPDTDSGQSMPLSQVLSQYHLANPFNLLQPAWRW